MVFRIGADTYAAWMAFSAILECYLISYRNYLKEK